MRKRSREINVFSISALDLFASALGAFILIMVILLPYFPNLGDSAERVAEIQTDLQKLKAREAEAKKITEALKGRLENLEKEKNALKGEVEKEGQTIRQIQFPHIDLVVALDTTGSMRDEIEGLKTELAGLAQIMTALTPSFGMGIIGFKDRTDRPVISSVPLREIRVNSQAMRSLQAFVNTLSAGSNPSNQDNEEAIGAALRDAIAMNWRQRSQLRVIVILSDHAAYSEEVEMTLRLARQFSATEGQRISAVAIRSATDVAVYMPRLAEAGKGTYVKGGGSITATILQALLKS
jgi:archaellum component FlaC